MKKNLLVFFALATLFASCSKDKDEATPNTVTANVNGKDVTFSVQEARLSRNVDFGYKDLLIAAVGNDNATVLFLSISEDDATGNAVSVRSYTMTQSPEDNPSTPDDDESDIYAATLYQNVQNQGSFTDYSELGALTVTACDANTTTISGTFETTLTSDDDANNKVVIKNGRINSVKYTVDN